MAVSRRSLDIAILRGGALQTNCYILISGDEALAVDPGWRGVAGRVSRVLEKRGASLKTVVLTHLHFDHTMGVGELWETTGADVVVGRVEYYAARSLRGVFIDHLGVELFPPLEVEPSALVSEGDVVKVGEVELRVVEAPGHTPGSIVLIGPGFAITGDVIFKNTVGRVDLPGSDPEAMEESLEKLAREIPESYAIYPGHGPPTVMREELENNPFMRGRARL